MWQLPGYSQSGIVLADAVARGQSSKLRGRLARNDDDLVEVTFPPPFEEEGNISDREGVLRRVERREPFVRHFTHERMNDSFEGLSRLGVRKHDRAELRSISAPVESQISGQAAAASFRPGVAGATASRANVSASIVGTPRASKRERT